MQRVATDVSKLVRSNVSSFAYFRKKVSLDIKNIFFDNFTKKIKCTWAGVTGGLTIVISYINNNKNNL
jgi:hypothetical protein